MSKSRNEDTQAPAPAGELRLRIASGLVLSALSLAALLLGVWPFALLTALLVAAASWEWGRMARGGEADAWTLVHAGLGVAACLMAAAGQAGLAAFALLIGAIVLGFLRLRSGDRLTGPGLLAVGLPAVVLVWLRGDPPLGLLAVVAVFAIVWTTDTAAFATGRTLGGPRLWPRLSPKKTWAGAIGGLVAALLAGGALGLWLHGAVLSPLAPVAGLLSVAAQLGDLAESALKRAAGRKDSSRLIPGHGGVLDRVDGLLAAALAAGAIALLRNPASPAAGLLLWP